MAPRKTAQTPTAGAESPLTKTDHPIDFKAFLKPSTGLAKVSRTRDGSVNPLAGAVAYSVDNPQMIPVPLALPDGKSADARAVTNYLRRDLGDQELRLSVQYQDDKGNVLHTKRTKDENGATVTTYPEGVTQVHFVAKPGKTERKYTADDIRAWAKDNGHGEITGKIPANVREAFKLAKGYAKDNDQDKRSA